MQSHSRTVICETALCRMACALSHDLRGVGLHHSPSATGGNPRPPPASGLGMRIWPAHPGFRVQSAPMFSTGCSCEPVTPVGGRTGVPRTGGSGRRPPRRHLLLPGLKARLKFKGGQSGLVDGCAAMRCSVLYENDHSLHRLVGRRSRLVHR